MNHQRVFAKIDLDAIKSNMERIRTRLQPGTKMMAVVKTDAYGHGSVPVAKALQELSFLYGFGVATAEEALELRLHGISLPILILGYTFPDAYEELVKQEIRPALFREDMIHLLGEAAAKQKKTLKVHIKVDTGMSRIGIRPDESGLDFIGKVIREPGLEIEGIFTHFAKADEADKSSAKKQFEVFETFVNAAEQRFSIHIPVKHCCNSAGALEMPYANMDVVRPGIIVYGLTPSDEVDTTSLELHPALSLYSHVIFIKTLEPGREISYGGICRLQRETRVATVPVGYGDGYPRSLSNVGYVLIHGKKAPILGRVCMDQMMVDVTGIPEAEEGDLVTLVGRDQEEWITAEQIGELSGRFNYEFVCDLGKRIPRIYSYEGKLFPGQN